MGGDAESTDFALTAQPLKEFENLRSTRISDAGFVKQQDVEIISAQCLEATSNAAGQIAETERAKSRRRGRRRRYQRPRQWPRHASRLRGPADEVGPSQHAIGQD